MRSRSGKIGDEYIRRVLETYSAPIIRLCYTYVKSKEEAEDIAQDVFLELIRQGKEFDDPGYEKAWLMKTAVNKCKNTLRSFRLRKNVPLEDVYAENDKEIENSESPVFKAVMDLPEKYRTPVHLFYVNGFTIKEISYITGRNAATVGTQLARGRELLKEMLKGEIEL